jgi:hypothetical protein
MPVPYEGSYQNEPENGVPARTPDDAGAVVVTPLKSFGIGDAEHDAERTIAAEAIITVHGASR